jgi:AcrR family transcriptional regulator
VDQLGNDHPVGYRLKGGQRFKVPTSRCVVSACQCEEVVCRVTTAPKGSAAHEATPAHARIPDRKRRMILDAAATILLRRAMPEPAWTRSPQSRGNPKATIYRNFVDKQTLFSELVATSVKATSDAVQAEIMYQGGSRGLEGELRSTAAAALGVPFHSGLYRRRNAAAGKLCEQRLAAYIDAMVHLQSVETCLNETLEDPDFRSRRKRVDVPHQDLISARLRLVASAPVIRSWQELVDAWDSLAWNVEQDGPINDRGDYHLKSDDQEVVKVHAAMRTLTISLRGAMGILMCRVGPTRAQATMSSLA